MAARMGFCPKWTSQARRSSVVVVSARAACGTDATGAAMRLVASLGRAARSRRRRQDRRIARDRRAPATRPAEDARACLNGAPTGVPDQAAAGAPGRHRSRTRVHRSRRRADATDELPTAGLGLAHTGSTLDPAPPRPQPFKICALDLAAQWPRAVPTSPSRYPRRAAHRSGPVRRRPLCRWRCGSGSRRSPR
jgi:hypothetical protein